jgi:hypothetical protein
LITLKSLNEVVEGMINNIHDKLPNADTKEGTFLRDVFIDPVADEVVGLNFDMKIMETNQSILTATDEDLERLASNYGITRNEATKSSGFIRFYFKTTDTDTVIYGGTVVQTVPTYATSAKSFTTTNTKDIYYVSDNSTLDREQYEYYQIINLSNLTLGDSGYYYYDVDALSSDTGSAYNVSANTVIRKSSTLDNNILTFGNPIAFTGGSDNESDTSLRMRIRLALLGANIGTKYGYMSYIYNSDYVEDASVVSAGDDDMLRDLDDNYEHSGGMVDIYVKGKKSDTATFTSNISLDNLGYTDSYAYTPLIINLKRKPLTDINSITYNKVLSDGSTTTRYLRNASNYDYESVYTNLTELGSPTTLNDIDINASRLTAISKVIDELDEKIENDDNFHDFYWLDSEDATAYIGNTDNLNGYEPEYTGNVNFNVYSNYLYRITDTDRKAPYQYAMYYMYAYTDNGDITEDQKRYFAIKFSFGVGDGNLISDYIVRDENGVTVYYSDVPISSIEDFSLLDAVEDEDGNELKLSGPEFDDNGYLIKEGTKFTSLDYVYNNEDDCYYYYVDTSSISDIVKKGVNLNDEDIDAGSYYFFVKFNDDIFSGNIEGDNFTNYSTYDYYSVKQEYVLYKNDAGEWQFFTIDDEDFSAGVTMLNSIKREMCNICNTNVSDKIVTQLTTVSKSIDIEKETYVADEHGYIREYYGDGDTTDDYYEYTGTEYSLRASLPYKFTVHRNIYNEIIAIDFVFAIDDMVNSDADEEDYYYYPNYEYTIIKCLDDNKTKLFIYEKMDTPDKRYFKDTKLTYSNFFTSSSDLLIETVQPLVTETGYGSSLWVSLLSEYINDTDMQNNILLQMSNYKNKLFNYKSDVDFGNEETNVVTVYNKPYIYVIVSLTNDETIINVKVYVSAIPNIGVVSCHLIMDNTNYNDDVIGLIDEESIYSDENSDSIINNGNYLEDYTLVDGVLDIIISEVASDYYRENKGDTCIFERNFYRKTYEKDGETLYSPIDLDFTLSDISIRSTDNILMSYEKKESSIVFGEDTTALPSILQFDADDEIIKMFSITEHIVNSRIYKIDFNFPLTYMLNEYTSTITFVKKAEEYYVRNYTTPDFALVETNSLLYGGSIMSNYRIKWFNPYNILNDTGTVGTNCYITVNYNYNSLIYTLQQKIASVKCLTADVLVKSAEEYPLEILLSVQFDDTQEVSDTKTNIIDTLTEQINDSAQLGITLKKSDIIAIVQRMDGVYYVESSETEIRKVHGEAQNIIKLKGNQYFYLRNIAITTIEDTE